MVSTRDGVRLATDVYLPPRAGRTPVVLIRLPYGKRGAIALMPQIAAFLMDSGYAVVVQDVRGKLRSEGQTLAFVNEVDDGFDTLEWVAAQPWCNGKVGMIGDSYYGWTQWAAAASRHPALKAIVPRVTSTRIAGDWMYHGGAFCLGAIADWAALTWVDRALHEYERDWSVRPLRDLLPVWLAGARSASLDAWAAAGPHGDLWRKGAFGRVDPSVIRIPALHMGGWWDIFRRGQLADWRAARAGGRASQFLLMDATDHQWDLLDRGDGLGTPSVVEGSSVQEFLPRYLGPVVEFLERFLRGTTATSAPPPVRVHVAGAGWLDGPTWPPAGCRELVLWLTDAARAPLGPEGGALSHRPDAFAHTVRWTHRGDDPVPTLDRDVWWPLLDLPDERDVEVRDDVITFTGEPQDRPLDLAGPVQAELRIRAEPGPVQVAVKLVDVRPDGRARRITEGIATVGEPEHGSTAIVCLGEMAYRVESGHRLRLEVAGSDFPRYLPVTGVEGNPWSATSGVAVEQSLETGRAAGSRLRLLVRS